MVIDVNWLGHIAHVVTPGITLIGHNGGDIHFTQLLTKCLHGGAFHTIHNHIDMLADGTYGNSYAFQAGECTGNTFTVSLVTSGAGAVVDFFATRIELIKGKRLGVFPAARRDNLLLSWLPPRWA